MKLRALILAAIAVHTTLCAQARGEGSHGTELPFTAGTGGRAAALGLAATSLTGDPSLQHFNAASLALARWKTLEVYRTTFFDSKSTYHTLSYVHPMLNYGSLGVSVLRLDVGGIEERNADNVLLSSDLKNAHTRLLVGYAASIRSSLAAGVNLKIDNQSFGGYSGSGVGLDLGFLASKAIGGDSFLRRVSAGLAIQNLVEPTVKLDQDDVPDPINVTLGASAVAGTRNMSFVTTLDAVSPRYSPRRLRFGQEICYADVFAVRVGLDGSTPTFGAGAMWRGVTVNYAYRDEDLGANHRISLTLRFGQSLDEQQESARARLEAEMKNQINSKLSQLETAQLTETMTRADSLFAGGRYVEAAAQYELALLWDAGNGRARDRIDVCRYHEEMTAARSLMQSDDLLQALYHLRRALGYAPGDPEAANLVAKCDSRMRAQQDLTEMVHRMLKRSIDLYASRHFVEALAGFREVLRLDPGNKLASEYEQKSSVNVQDAKRALELEAKKLADRGDFTLAIASLQDALRLTPGDQAITARIEALKPKQAAETARRDAASGPAAPSTIAPVRPAVDAAVLEPKFNEGLRFFEKGDFDAAAVRLQEVWTLAPDFHNVRELLAKTYLFIGMKMYSEEKYGEAITTWEKALMVDPGNPKARRYLLKAREEESRLGSVNNG